MKKQTIWKLGDAKVDYAKKTLAKLSLKGERDGFTKYLGNQCKKLSCN